MRSMLQAGKQGDSYVSLGTACRPGESTGLGRSLLFALTGSVFFAQLLGSLRSEGMVHRTSEWSLQHHVLFMCFAPHPPPYYFLSFFFFSSPFYSLPTWLSDRWET